MRDIQTISKLYENGVITVCPLGKRTGKLSDLEAQKRKQRGLITKTFVLSSKEKRLLRCSCIRMFRTKKYSLKWFTLTFPTDIGQKDANICLSKFLENLKLTYHAHNYVVVKENTKIGRPHFHCIIDMPFTSFETLNISWCHAFSNFCNFSPNALTSGENKVIHDIRGVAVYVSKYISKTVNDIASLTRLYFISENTLSKPAIIGFNDYVYLTTTFSFSLFVSDFFTVYFLENFNYLPEMFLLSIKKPPKVEKTRRDPDFIQSNFAF